MICGCNFFSRKNNSKKIYCIVCKKYIKLPDNYVKFLLDGEENRFKCKKCEDKYLCEEIVKISIDEILFV